MDEPEFSLVIPFIVCDDQDGPYNGESYVAGFETGIISAELSIASNMPQGLSALPASRYVHTGIVPQLDLIAMNYNYTITPGATDDSGEWTWVEFGRSDS